ncbi:alternate-type signal peptide domain-containing protein [Prescottella soli]|uniref:Alternate-type signal peptide domain-containing protein n=1 Tax=Prescottella soli TaxID=1543852 RepID=A0ABW9FNK5_9NOCA
MNKKTKGAIAAGAAALLLAGGAGTFATWNAQANLNGGSVNSGKLTLTATGSTWSDSHGVINNWANFKAVPGDVLTYNAQATIGAVGKNLNASLTVDPASITGALAASLGTPTVTAKIGSNPVTTITEANDGNVVDVAVSFTFSSAADNTTQNLSASLANMTLKLQQQ